MRGMLSGGRLAVGPYLDHADSVAWRSILDVSHEAAHQKQASAAGTLEVFWVRWVGNIVGIETGAFVSDVNLELAVIDGEADMDFLVWVHLIAVFDRIDQRFL